MKILAIDIGGTDIKHGIFENNSIQKVNQTPTNTINGAEYLFEMLCKIIDSYSFDAIAVSTAGQVHPTLGYITFSKNIKGYTGFQLKKRLVEKYNVGVIIENDVNAMALGELHFGGGRAYDNILCLTYGTGVGGAIIIDKKIYHGSTFCAGEFGALITHEQDRKNAEDFFDGCYERYASVTSLIDMCKKIDSKFINGKIIFENISNNNLKIVVDLWIDEIVLGLQSLIHIFNPSCVILGGGVLSQEYIITKISEILPQKLMPNFKKVVIKRAELENSAGMYGVCTRILNKI